MGYEIKNIWEEHINRLTQKILVFLETEKYGEVTALKVQYSLHVIIGEFEKFLILCILFACMGTFLEYVIAYLSIVMLRIFTGGIHQKTIYLCFVHTFVNILMIIIFGQSIELNENKGIPFLVLAISIVLFAPIQSEYRIHYNRAKRLEFKAKALIIVTILMFLCQRTGFVFSNIIVCTSILQAIELSILGFKTCMKQKFKNK